MISCFVIRVYIGVINFSYINDACVVYLSHVSDLKLKVVKRLISDLVVQPYLSCVRASLMV